MFTTAISPGQNLCTETLAAIAGSIYGTNHTKLNILRAYPFSENAREMDTGTDIPIPVPFLLFTLYRNRHLVIS